MLAWLTGKKKGDDADGAAAPAAAAAARDPSEPLSDAELCAFQFDTTPDARVPIVYTDAYNIGFMGLEKLHPFDSAKYEKVYRSLTEERLLLLSSEVHQPVEAPHAVLRRVHPQSYLEALKNSSNVADIVEVPVGILPNAIVDKHVLKPMRFATAGTLLAADLALRSMRNHQQLQQQEADDGRAEGAPVAECAAAAADPPGDAALVSPAEAGDVRAGWALSLSGGYHHCSAHQGGGFCAYADISLAVILLAVKYNVKRAMIVDCDAHQGNGYENDKRNNVFRDAGLDSVFILDMFNHRIYPRDVRAAEAIDCPVRLESGTGDAEYLRLLRHHLSASLARARPEVLIYNAGTDCLAGDRLGQLDVSPAGIVERDRIVFDLAFQARVPVVMLLSGGYQKTNAAVIAASIANLQEQLHLWAVTPQLQEKRDKQQAKQKISKI
jgi:histone deacetylase 11